MNNNCTTSTSRKDWVNQAGVLQQWASQAEQDLLVSLQSLSDMEGGCDEEGLCRGGVGSDNAAVVGGEGGGDCSASALLASYWQSLSDHNIEMSQVSRCIAWSRALRQQQQQQQSTPYHHSTSVSPPSSSSSQIKDTIRQCDAEIDLITNGYGEEGLVRASSALVAFIETDMFRSEAYSLRNRQDREVRDAERRRESWRVTELEVQRKLEHLRAIRGGAGSGNERVNVNTAPSSASCPLPLNPKMMTATLPAQPDAQPRLDHHHHHIQPQHPNLREVLATVATTSKQPSPVPPRTHQYRDPTSSPSSSTPPAVVAYEAFLEQFPFERRASLGWEAEDHAVFMRCVLACDGGGGGSTAPSSSSPTVITAVPPQARPLQDVSAHHSQQSNTSTANTNTNIAACVNGVEYWQMGNNNSNISRRPIPLPCGAKPDLPYAVVPATTITTHSSSGHHHHNQRINIQNVPSSSTFHCSQNKGDVDVMQLCMRELPHMPLSDIQEHYNHFAHYTSLHKAKRVAIEVFRADREASRQQENAITCVRQEKDVLEHQHSEAKREYKRLLRHAENKEKVDQWKSQKQQALRARADAILLSHNGGVSTSFHHHNHHAPSSHPSASMMNGHQAATMERARHVGAGVQLMQCGRGFRDMTASELQVILRAHDCEDDVGPLCTVNRALLERLIAEKEDETRRRMQFERIQHRQEEIKGDVLEYKRVKEARRIVDDMREEEFLRMNGYPVPPKKYRASSSFATSGVTSHTSSMFNNQSLSPRGQGVESSSSSSPQWGTSSTPRVRGASVSTHGYTSPSSITNITSTTTTATPLQRSLWEKDAAFLAKRTEQLNAKGRRSDSHLLSRNDRIRAKYESSGLKDKFDAVYGKRLDSSTGSGGSVGSPPSTSSPTSSHPKVATQENTIAGAGANDSDKKKQQVRAPSSSSLSRLTAPTKAWEQRERAALEEAALCKTKGLWSGSNNMNVGRKASAGWMK